MSNLKATYVVVVGVDYSELSAVALAEAVRFARARERSHLHIVHVAPDATPLPVFAGGLDPTVAGSAAVPQPSPSSLTSQMVRDVQAYVEKTLRQLQTNDQASETATAPIRWTVHLRESDPAHAICQLAADVEADLVVVGTHARHGLARYLLGSVAESVVRLAPCPVLAVRARGTDPSRDQPQIEPPCPDCLETRRATQGQEFWCARHREHHGRAHTYHITPFQESHQSGLLIHP